MSCSALPMMMAGFLPLTIVSLLIVIMVGALIYMWGHFIKKTEYINLGKSELYQAFLTAILAASYTTFAYLSQELTCFATGNTVFDEALLEMSTLMNGQILPVLKTLFYITIVDNSVANLRYEIGSISFQMFNGLRHFTASVGVLVFIMEATYASIYIQSLALVIFRDIAFPVLFPLGVLLRAFVFTRDAGLYLMTISLAFYTVYPFLLWQGMEIYQSIHPPYDYVSALASMNVVGNDDSYILSYIIYGLTAFTYRRVDALFMDMGGHVFAVVVVTAFALLFTIATSGSMIRFFKEVGL